MLGTLCQPLHPRLSRNSGVSPAAVSERAEPAAAGVRGGCVRGVGARQFRGCSPSGGGIASTREQRRRGGAPEGVTVDVGPKTPGAGRKADVGRPPPSPRRRGGLWEGREVGEEAWGQTSSAVTGRAARRSVGGSPQRVPGSGLWGGPSDIAPGAGWNLPCRGRGRAELPSGTAGGRGPHRRRGSGALERSRGRGGRRRSGPAAAGRYPEPAFKSAASRRRPRRCPSRPERRRPAFSGYGGEVGPRDRAAGRGVVDSKGLGLGEAKRGEGGAGATRNS